MAFNINDWQPATQDNINFAPTLRDNQQVIDVIDTSKVDTILTKGLNVLNDKIGFYDGTQWKSWIGADGTFGFYNDDNTSYFRYDGTTFEFAGTATFSVSDIEDGTITNDKIANTTITNDKIANTTITGSKIATATLTADKIAANAITADKIAANAITADKIAANAITADKIAANTITASQIASNTITSAEIAANTITASQIATDYAYTGSLSANQITTGTLDANLTMTNTLQLSTNGNIYGGKSTFTSTAAGFWMGYDSGAYKFKFGNSSKYIAWDGTNLTLTGDIIQLGDLPTLTKFGQDTSVYTSSSSKSGNNSDRYISTLFSSTGQSLIANYPVKVSASTSIFWDNSGGGTANVYCKIKVGSTTLTTANLDFINFSAASQYSSININEVIIPSSSATSVSVELWVRFINYGYVRGTASGGSMYFEQPQK